jgi:hypothetical protein
MKALTARQVIEKKRVIYEFTERYAESFGSPEKNAIWMIFGKSGNGKTHFVLLLCKYLAENFGSVAYNSLEEGDKKSFAIALEHVGMIDVHRFNLIPSIPMNEFVDRLAKRHQSNFAVIDSIQYSGITYHDHAAIKKRLKNKSLIYISHGNGNNPDGKTADKVRYDADIKVHVIGFIASVRSRYGGNKPFIIWEEGAKKYWGKKYPSVIAGKYWPGDKK